jgi:hypothetical protein
MFTFIIGITCNFVAVTQNKGRMPVYTCYYVDDDKYFAYENNSEVNYPILTDRFYIHNKIFSIGDLIMISSMLGIFGSVSINLFTKYGSYR